MKRASLVAAAAILLVADAFALIHARWNRLGPPETDITLTERELPLGYNADEEDTSVTLDLRWMDISWEAFGQEQGPRWANPDILRELGFDTSVPPSDPRAIEFYNRQRPRRAFVALEYDGPAWQTHVKDTARQAREQGSGAQARLPLHTHDGETRLIVVDAGSAVARLRRRHPDRHSVMIVPAVVRITLELAARANGDQPARPARLSAAVQQIPASIHVPEPLSDLFRRWQRNPSQIKYRVRLLYGAENEPWVAAVETPAPSNP